MTEYVEFELSMFAEELSDFTQTDVSCKITNELTLQYNLKYGEDFWFESSFFKPNGVRVLEFGFKDSSVAFIAKLIQ